MAVTSVPASSASEWECRGDARRLYLGLGCQRASDRRLRLRGRRRLQAAGPGGWATPRRPLATLVRRWTVCPAGDAFVADCSGPLPLASQRGDHVRRPDEDAAEAETWFQRVYSTISASNTFAREPGRRNGGQQTNCRVNALANAALVAGRRLTIWYRNTEQGLAEKAEWQHSNCRRGIDGWRAADGQLYCPLHGPASRPSCQR